MSVEDCGETAEIILPLLVEELSVARKSVRSGGVRVRVATHERTETVQEALRHETVQVERIAINRMVDDAPPTRIEGDLTIVSIVEEVLVTEKRLMLKEEIRIRKIVTSDEHVENVILREQMAVIEPLPSEKT